MSGFVGSRARKRNRNFFLTSILVLIAIIFFLFFSESEKFNNELIPNDTLIPNPIKDLTSVTSDIEELELLIFQKDQKIKFRDGQIKNIQTELENSILKHKIVISELNNNYDSLFSENKKLISTKKYNLLQDNFKKINIKYDKSILKIKNLNKIIDERKKIPNSEYNNLKKNLKGSFAKNMKSQKIILDLQKKIKEQQLQIDSQLKEIKKLNNNSHHGG